MTSVPGSWCREYFHKGDKKFKNDKYHLEHRCRGCVARLVGEIAEQDEGEVASGVREYVRSQTDLVKEALTQVPPVCGKLERMLPHLAKCTAVTPEVRALAKASQKKENNDGSVPRLSRNQQVARAAVLQLPLPPAIPQTRSRSNLAAPQSPTTILDAQMAFAALNISGTPQPAESRIEAPTRFDGTMWDPSRQQEFAEDLCKLFIACNISWNSAGNPELFLFFSKYVPEAKIPDRRVLSGRVLDALAAQAETSMKSKVLGKLATGQCDGYKSSARAAIVTMSITVEALLYMIAAHDISP
ncbi:hypothetical protein MVEN_01721700 [Mycena venus]|uniref:Uncharacterized protein n=1 Tax=Mycena venus TaxID=2733690 RepID=A0A8H6XPW0_9AGAR|nr:hypothetical protein MVEN_01721700 [Mycena venus]